MPRIAAALGLVSRFASVVLMPKRVVRMSVTPAFSAFCAGVPLSCGTVLASM